MSLKVLEGVYKAFIGFHKGSKGAYQFLGKVGPGAVDGRLMNVPHHSICQST